MNDTVHDVDLDALLAPLSPAQPCGADINGGPTYGAIREARRADDLHLPHGDWEKPVHKRSDWALAERLCMEALRKESKDLNIVGWLCEAWIHLRGLAGLADGLHLMAAMADRYWDQVHPLMEGGDIGFRTSPFDWLARNLPPALRSVSLAPGATPAGRALTLGEWDSVLRAERQAAQAAAVRRGRYTPPPPPPEQTLRAHFGAAASMAPADFYDVLGYEVEAARLTLEQLGSVLDGRMGEYAPSLAPLAAVLDACGEAVLELGSLTQAVYEEESGVDEEVTDMSERAGLPPLRRAAIDSRAEAYRRLGEVADYLQRTEPHSPVPYLVRRAISWGEMPLEELLQELLDSESDLKQIYRLLGTGGK